MALWTVAHQAPLSMGFSRQEYWSGLWKLHGFCNNLYCSPDLLNPSLLSLERFPASQLQNQELLQSYLELHSYLELPESIFPELVSSGRPCPETRQTTRRTGTEGIQGVGTRRSQVKTRHVLGAPWRTSRSHRDSEQKFLYGGSQNGGIWGAGEG